MVTRLIYYCEKLDTEIEVRALNKEFDIEDHTPVKCVLTGEEIDDYYYDTLEAVSYTHLTLPTKA